MPSSHEKFIALLRDDILKFDLAELDFGIYRILRYRRAEIEQFLQEVLPQRMREAVRDRGQERLAQVRQTLARKREQLEGAAPALGLPGAFMDDALHPSLQLLPAAQEFQALQQELAGLEAAAGFTQSEEEFLYNHLYTFFSRYYRDGDFEPQPRRSRNATYVVPYHGEDVHFGWRSRGSHYVKTAEELRRYRFRASQGWHAEFELVEADVEQENVKGKTRFFVPLPQQARTDEGARRWTLPFAFRPLTPAEDRALAGNGERLQDQLLEQVMAALADHLPPAIEPELLRRQMRRYARKNRSDYFVHPHLGRFLRGELDYYLKNEFLLHEALTSPEQLSDRLLKYHTLHDVSEALIAFLDSIESLQAHLWEKRRFVTGVSYLIPVRWVPRDLWLEVLANPAQRAAWRTLFALEGELTEETLATRPTLVVDTRHFDEGFTLRALAAYDDLDEATDGLLVHAENYGALRTLEPLLRDRVQAIYLDPPYNTGNDGFIYKDEFARHSTWLSMMADRLRLGRALLSSEGVMFISIDDNEQARLKQVADAIFQPENFIATVIWQKVFAPKNTAKHFSEDHDFILVYARNGEEWRPYLLPRSAEADARYTNPDDDPRGPWSSSDLTARNYYSEGQYEVSSPSGAVFGPTSGRYWALSQSKFLTLDQDNRVWWGEGGNNMPRLKRFLSEVKAGIVPQTLWKHEDVGNTQEAKKELLAIVSFARTEDVLNTVKPTRLIHRVLHIGTTPELPAWVVDFFAGSGTTGHAVISLNRADGGQRRFALVEMGEYFEALVFQRIVRAMYAPAWRDGRPVEEPLVAGFQDEAMLPDWMQRSPRLVKVLRLESYDEALDALELPEERAHRQAGQQALFADELRYLYEQSEVMLNRARLEQPFAYTLRVHTPEGVRHQPINLVETANLLLGLRVQRLREVHHDLGAGQARRYVVVEGRERDGRRALVIWRDVREPQPLDPAAERDFLRQHIALSDFDAIYTNADSVVATSEVPLDQLLRERMLERDAGAAP